MPEFFTTSSSPEQQPAPIPHHYASTPAKTPLEKLKNVVSSLFGNPDHEKEVESARLLGRIKELDNSAAHLQQELKQIKEKLSQNVDTELIMNALGSVEKEMERLKILKKNTPTEQQEAIQKYDNWITKAKFWADRFSTSDSDRLTQTAIEIAVDAVFEQIDRDLQVLQNYLNQSNKKSSLLQDKLLEILSPMKDLKKVALPKTAEELIQFKLDVDKIRERCHNQALHLIDEMPIA